MTDPRRGFPSMDSLLKRPEVAPWLGRYGRQTVKESLRRALDRARAAAGAERQGVEDVLCARGMTSPPDPAFRCGRR